MNMDYLVARFQINQSDITPAYTLTKDRQDIFISPKAKLRHSHRTYTKALHPQKISRKPFSLKFLDLATTSNSLNDSPEEINDDKSCCCFECGRRPRKEKALSRKFKAFRPKMHVVKESRIRLCRRFQTAVRVIIWLIRKHVIQRKLRAKEKTRKMMRLKTKVFDPSLVQTQMLTSEHFQQADSATQGEADRYTMMQSVQLKLIDQRLKARQSIQSYVQSKKSSESEIIKQGDSPLLPKLRSPNKIIRKIQGNSQKQINLIGISADTPRHQKSNSSPYLLQPTLTIRSKDTIEFVQPTSPIKPQTERSKRVQLELFSIQKQIVSPSKRKFNPILKDFLIK